MDSIFGFSFSMLSGFLLMLQIRILINPFYALWLLVNHIIKESSPLSVNIKFLWQTQKTKTWDYWFSWIYKRKISLWNSQTWNGQGLGWGVIRWFFLFLFKMNIKSNIIEGKGKMVWSRSYSALWLLYNSYNTATLRLRKRVKK